MASLFSGGPDILAPYAAALKMNSESPSASFGIIFGRAPARKAGKLISIEALRSM